METRGRALAFFRRVVKESGCELVRALPLEREFIRHALPLLLTPDAPVVKGTKLGEVLPEGIKRALVRTLPQVATDAARSESDYWMAFYSSYA